MVMKRDTQTQNNLMQFMTSEEHHAMNIFFLKKEFWNTL